MRPTFPAMINAACTCPDGPPADDYLSECPDCFFFSDRSEPFRYQLEVHPTSAAIYVGGDECDAASVDSLATIAFKLPYTVRTLRVDIRALTRIDLDTLVRLRSMLAAWRSARHGAVRLNADAASVRKPILRVVRASKKLVLRNKAAATRQPLHRLFVL